MNIFKSYAQNMEDVLLWRCFKDVENGTYLDIGANDPNIDSISRGFYENGWRGTHVQPLRFFTNHLRDRRPDETVIEAVVGVQGGSARFYQVSSLGLSTGIEAIARKHEQDGLTVEEIEVPAMPLSEVLAPFAGKDLHWLKIDVEGMEADIITSWSPSTVRPWVVVIKSTSLNSTPPAHEQWEAQLLDLGYRYAYFDGVNRFYVSEAHADLARHFATGPNIFDHFVLVGNQFSEHPDPARIGGQTEVYIRQLETEKQKAGERLQEAEQKLRSLGIRLENADGRIEQMHDMIIALKADNAALSATNETLGVEKSALEEKLDALALTHDRMIARCGQLEIKLKAVEWRKETEREGEEPAAGKQAVDFSARHLDARTLLAQKIALQKKLSGVKAELVLERQRMQHVPIAPSRSSGWIFSRRPPKSGQLGRSVPHMMFDVSYYLATNPDVAQAGANPLQHYIRHGAKEGRAPHPLFDPAWYLAHNPDVKAAQLNPLEHYFTLGWKEGRNPHVLFDTAWYLRTYPDVTGSGVNPLEHFLAHGAKEGRDPHPLFNTRWYVSQAPDAAETPLQHYWLQGRFRQIDPHPAFLTGFYREQSSELGDFSREVIQHYMGVGWRSGFSPLPFFDGKWYLDTYPDVRASGMVPLVHYLHLGWLEARDPSDKFSTRFYLEQYEDVRVSGINPLVHYIRFGAGERLRQPDGGGARGQTKEKNK